MGYEGANVLFDTWAHPLMMGLEEHLLTMFREDFEFHNEAAPSHLGLTAERRIEPEQKDQISPAPIIHIDTALRWQPDAEQELRKIPFFVRGKARRNTEHYAQEQGIAMITLETLYDAKAHFSR
jgi:light-independent protochlorophyllide reductase subunit B